MNILSITEKIRSQTREFGKYRYVAEVSGVSYEWLVKFAVGKISNPTVENINKLEKFFHDQDFENKNAGYYKRRLDDRHIKTSP